jgi:hypothetical protein
MGYTIHWEPNKALASEEVGAAFAHLYIDHNARVLRLEVYRPGKLLSLAPLREVPVEALTIEAGEDGIAGGFCKTNRIEPENTEVRRLLVGLNRVVDDKLHIHCDDGFEYTSEGISVPRGDRARTRQVTLPEVTVLRPAAAGGDAV